MCIKVTRKITKDVGMAFKYTLMALNMRANGKMTKPMASVNLRMVMALLMKDSGPMIRKMVMGSIHTKIVVTITRVTGRMMSKTVMENPL